jgi:soluble lytic murein transglycosylase
MLCVFPLSLAIGPASAQSPSELEGRRGEVSRTMDQAERGPVSAFEQSLRTLGDHPLRPWLEYARLRNSLDSNANASIEAYLARWGDIVPARMLRNAWLRQLADRGDWDRFATWYRDSSDTTLRCGHLRARQARGGTDAGWLEDAEQLWLSPRSLPDLCNPAFEVLLERGLISPELRWRRIELAAEAGEHGLARFVARGLPADQAALASDYLNFIEAPHERARQWPATDRSRKFATLGLVRLARNDPDRAERLLAELRQPLRKAEADAGPVQAQVALWTVASYNEGARERLAAVPASAYDDRLHEWRVREALARRDDRGALDAIAGMPAAQREDSRWRYFEARLRERSGEADQARALYADAARHATFHGFLAADRINAPYALCPLEVQRDLALRRDVAANPALVRALELFRMDRPGWAAREWNDALAGMSDAERLEAVRLARAIGWHDRIFALAQGNPEELRYYRLRFPLSYPSTVREQAELHDLDPALVAAVTRAESAWMPRARSPADARGLMQVLPATAAGVARRVGIGFDGPDTLYRPITNLRLGTAYMREMLDRHGGRPYFAIAAYNAGPTPVARWRGERADFDPDFWIETINFRETREYVARVMAFSVIYDWRLGNDAVPVSDRLLGRSVNASSRRAFQCPDAPTEAAP